MSPRVKDGVVKVTAYVPEDVWDKTVSFMCHNAVADNGKPTLTGYGAISNTVSSALDNYCNIVYNYNVLTPTVNDEEAQAKAEYEAECAAAQSLAQAEDEARWQEEQAENDRREAESQGPEGDDEG